MSRRTQPLHPLFYVLPSGYAVPFIVFGVAWTLLGGACTSVTAVSQVAEGKAAAAELLGGALVLGFLVFPVSALLLGVGALMAGRWAARAPLLGASLVALLLGLGASLLNVAGDPEPMAGAVVMLFFFGGPIAVVLIALVVSAALGVGEVRAGREAARRLRMHELVTVRGEVDFATAGEELRLPAAIVPDYLAGLVARRELSAVLDLEASMAFSLDRYAQKERDLVSVAWGRGKATLTELAQELRLSPARLHALLEAATTAGTFAGFLDPRTGEVVSAAAAGLRHGRACPACGGQLDLAGNGVLTCPYCRAEVFLPRG